MTAQLATLLQDALGSAYRLERELEAGGMSRLFLATDVKLNRQVVVKVLPPDLVSTTSIARFKREIELTVRLQHPHILPILTSGEWEDGLYYVTPFIQGESLRDRIAREKRLPLDDILKILTDMGGALAFAHQRGVVHRDIKPGNVLLAEGHGILADFGIARAVSTTATPLTDSGVAPGTPGYMAPELPTDERADVYALGIVAYEMLCGTNSHDAVNWRSLVSARPNEPRRNKAQLRALAKLVAATIAPTPGERVNSAQAFVSRLMEVVRYRDRLRRDGWVLGGIALVAATVFAVGLNHWQASSRNAFGLPDTTRLVVFPFEREGHGVDSLESELLVEALGRWRGITIADPFQVADASARMGRNRLTNDDAGQIARSLGAGRYIRGQLSPINGTTRLLASIYDAKSGERLYTAFVRFARTPPRLDSILADLADSLLLRGASDAPGGINETRTRSNSLPAVEAFAGGLAALEEWDLELADSLFGLATSLDQSYSRAYLWQAQVREWRERSPESYALLIDHVVADSARFSTHERQLARALSLLARAEFPSACDAYENLRRANPRDFAAWFGLGRCRSLDELVVRDSRTPTGWAYRSSYHRAVLAYARALELLPLSHKGFARGGFERLQSLLFTRSDRLRLGHSAPPDTSRFAARPSWLGDSLVFVPLPLLEVQQASSVALLPGLDEALRQQRSLFNRIANSWAQALPRSAGVKEAVAVSLDLLGDASSIDTLRAVRRIVSSAVEQRRLAETEVILGLKYSVPDQVDRLKAVRLLADSIAQVERKIGLGNAAVISLAALVGDCELATNAAQTSAVDWRTPVRVPRALVAESTSLLIGGAMGCFDQPPISRIQHLQSLIDHDIAPSDLPLAHVMLTTQLRTLLFARGDFPTDQPIGSGAGKLLEAEYAAATGDSGRVRSILVSLRRDRRMAVATEGARTPDAVVVEAQLSIGIRDSAGARNLIDSTLAHVRDYTITSLRANQAAIPSIIRLMVLRADLAKADGDQVVARKWGRAVAILWKGASSPLQAVAVRMERLANQ